MLRVGGLLLLASGATAVNVPHVFTPFKDYRTETCPAGFERAGHKCTELEAISSVDVCPKGSRANGGGCFYVEEPEFECLEGKLLDGRICEVTKNAPVRHICPEGTVQEGDKCIVGTSLTVCPKHTAETPGGKCGKIVEKLLFCPEGTTEAGDLCEATEYSTPTKLCPDGTVLDGHKCVTAAHRDLVCPKGAVREGDLCAYFAPLEYECASGFHSDGKTCVREIEVGFEMECPAGGELVNDQCKFESEIERTTFCPKGVLVGDECVLDVNFPVSYQCPAGYSLEDGKKGLACVSTVTYDCSVTKYECDPEKSKELQVKAEKKNPTELIHEHIPTIPSYLRHLEGKIDPTDLIHHGYTPSIHDLHDYCYKVAVVHPKTCEKTTTADPIPYCAEGIYNGKDSCDVQVKEPAVLECEGTVNAHGVCVLAKSYHAVYVCPDGFTKVGLECRENDYGPVEFKCPDGFHSFEGGNQCVRYVDREEPHGGLLIELSVHPEIICPVGYVLEHDIHGRTECLKTIYIFKEPTCPGGTEEISSTTCGKLVPAVTLDDQVYVHSEAVCPDGFYLKHGECRSTTYEIATIVCPKDYLTEDNICIKPTDLVESCPKGAIQRNGVCYVDVSVKPLTVNSPVMKAPKDLPEIPDIHMFTHVLPTVPNLTIPKPQVEITAVPKTLPTELLTAKFIPKGLFGHA